MKKLILFVLLVLNFTTIGQCPPAEKFVRNKDEKGSYIQNSQSRSAYLRSGEIFETSFICQGGYDYRFTIGTEKKTSGNLKYEVYEMEVNRVQENGKSVYRKEKRVLYSSLDNTSISISTADSRKIFVKLLLESSDSQSIACTGILVEFKKSKKIGF